MSKTARMATGIAAADLVTVALTGIMLVQLPSRYGSQDWLIFADRYPSPPWVQILLAIIAGVALAAFQWRIVKTSSSTRDGYIAAIVPLAGLMVVAVLRYLNATPQGAVDNGISVFFIARSTLVLTLLVSLLAAVTLAASIVTRSRKSAAASHGITDVTG
jgi:hypothetical protein